MQSRLAANTLLAPPANALRVFTGGLLHTTPRRSRFLLGASGLGPSHGKLCSLACSSTNPLRGFPGAPCQGSECTPPTQQARHDDAAASKCVGIICKTPRETAAIGPNPLRSITRRGSCLLTRSLPAGIPFDSGVP